MPRLRSRTRTRGLEPRHDRSLLAHPAAWRATIRREPTTAPRSPQAPARHVRHRPATRERRPGRKSAAKRTRCPTPAGTVSRCGWRASAPACPARPAWRAPARSGPPWPNARPVIRQWTGRTTSERPTARAATLPRTGWTRTVRSPTCVSGCEEPQRPPAGRYRRVRAAWPGRRPAWSRHPTRAAGCWRATPPSGCAAVQRPAPAPSRTPTRTMRATPARYDQRASSSAPGRARPACASAARARRPRPTTAPPRRRHRTPAGHVPRAARERSVGPPARRRSARRRTRSWWLQGRRPNGDRESPRRRGPNAVRGGRCRRRPRGSSCRAPDGARAARPGAVTRPTAVCWLRSRPLPATTAARQQPGPAARPPWRRSGAAHGASRGRPRARPWRWSARRTSTTPGPAAAQASAAPGRRRSTACRDGCGALRLRS